VAIFAVDPSGTVKNWVIGFIFPITARSASALAVAFFRLLEPLSKVRFATLKLMQVSLVAGRSTVVLITLKKRKQFTREAHFAKVLSSSYKLALHQYMCLVKSFSMP